MVNTEICAYREFFRGRLAAYDTEQARAAS
jgi:hypothetical protein